MTETGTPTAGSEVERFIARWADAEAAERANYQMFLAELCDLLGVERPDPATGDNAANHYVFDRAINRREADGSTSTVFADLYKQDCFLLETKQGAKRPVEADSSRFSETKRQDAASTSASEAPGAYSTSAPRKTGHGVRGTKQWDVALEKAYNQAASYIRDLPGSEGRPPFLVVCDVGYVIELYSEFTCTGGAYVRFPDPHNHRIYLEELRAPAIRERLRAVWTDPFSLDPSRHAARVTRDVAEHLARLAKSLEEDGHDPAAIATFLQRCLFTLFAEDVGLLPEDSFTGLLHKLHGHPDGFAQTVGNLWKDMAGDSGWSVALMDEIAYFNGGLFENSKALPLKADQIGILLGAAKPDWSDVEPAIFGTLLERALSPRQRHKLGAHYTPRSYVERLVQPTIIEPLRERWDAAKTAAAHYRQRGEDKKAIQTVKDFHHELCDIRVLDPACGSGNFLYVTLEHMKRLEGEVLELLASLGDDELTFEMEQFKVRPQQFLGLEINEHAVAIAQLVLWIGYFQWHRKTTGDADTRDRPLLPKERTIRCQDAVLDYDDVSMRVKKVEAASSRLSERKRQDAASTLTDAELLNAAANYSYYNPYKKLDIVKANLPHWRQDEATYFVTFRLADSLPQQKLESWKAERDAWLEAHPEPRSDEEKSEYFEKFSARMEAWLDAGHGDCILADPACAEIVYDALRHFDKDRYDLGEHTVASNHVHALVTPKADHELSGIIHSWKSYTANELNKHLGRTGQVWQKEYYDHILRSANAAYRIEQYIKRHDTTVEAASSRFSERKRQDAASTEQIVTIWDGRTTKPHPATGREVPDENARIPVYDYKNPRRAEWPDADFVIGNPPFIGASRMREALGDGYTEALRQAWKGAVPDSADFVMYWWEKAAQLLAAGKLRRFGLITTNSVHQTFNRRILEKYLNVEAASSRLKSTPKSKRQDAASTPLHLAFAVPDHPWVDATDGAAVRIAMTVATRDDIAGELKEVVDEADLDDGDYSVEVESHTGKIAANLKVGPDLVSAVPLKANQGISSRGHEIGGSGFIISPEKATELGYGNDPSVENVIRGYRHGRDLTDHPRSVMLIDTYGLSVEQIREQYPQIYQHLLTHVKPSRDQNRMKSVRENWWLHRRLRKDLRNMMKGLARYISTVETSKHRFFQFLDASVLPDNMLVNIASDDAAVLGVLSSATHVAWALSTGGTLEDRPRYNKTRCFETFPFPDLASRPELRDRIRDLADQLDAHRKARQAAHPGLTITGMYNVLEKLRVEAASSRFSRPPENKRQDAASTASTASVLTDKEKTIHEEGLVSVLKEIHDNLDEAVLQAYGWDDLATAWGYWVDRQFYNWNDDTITELTLDPGTDFADVLAAHRESIEKEILSRLVALNKQRAAEEADGHIHWIRPEYQDPHYQGAGYGHQGSGGQSELPGTQEAQVSGLKSPPSTKSPWPKTLPERVAAIRALIPETGRDTDAIAARFGRRTKKRVGEIEEIVEMLDKIGQL